MSVLYQQTNLWSSTTAPVCVIAGDSALQCRAPASTTGSKPPSNIHSQIWTDHMEPKPSPPKTLSIFRMIVFLLLGSRSGKGEGH